MTGERAAHRLAGLLRQQPQTCTGCAAAELGLDALQILDAVDVLTRTVTVEERSGPCAVCLRSRWILSLKT